MSSFSLFAPTLCTNPVCLSCLYLEYTLSYLFISIHTYSCALSWLFKFLKRIRFYNILFTPPPPSQVLSPGIHRRCFILKEKWTWTISLSHITMIKGNVLLLRQAILKKVASKTLPLIERMLMITTKEV